MVLYIKIIIRRVLFEKVQRTGDCGLTGRFVVGYTSLPLKKQLLVIRYHRINETGSGRREILFALTLSDSSSVHPLFAGICPVST